MSLIDSHCHLDSPEFDADRDEVIERALGAGVEHMVAIGTGNGPPDLEAGIRLADKYPAILSRPSAFIRTMPPRPAQTISAAWPICCRIPKWSRSAKSVSIITTISRRARRQKSAFIEQMEIAAAAQKPIVIHTREAWDDTLALLEQHWKPHGIGGIMHCFSGGPEEARRALDLGFYLSFGGIVTFPKALEVQAAAKAAPPDRILVETDAPYLAPVPKRGKRNEPALIVHTAQKLADLRGESLEEVGH